MHIYIDNLKHKVFGRYVNNTEKRLNINYHVELTCGVNGPTSAHQLPITWVDDANMGPVYTSGHWFSHNQLTHEQLMQLDTQLARRSHAKKTQ